MPKRLYRSLLDHPGLGRESSKGYVTPMRMVVLCIFIGLCILLYSTSLSSSGDEYGMDAGVNQHRQVQTHASRYAIHDTRLRETMLQLNTLVSFSEQPAAPLTKENRDFLQGLIDTVSVIVESADFLKTEKKIAHLGDEQMAIYTRLGEQLYSEAVSIDHNAKKLELEEMNQAFLNLNQTCIKCHNLFRSL